MTSMGYLFALITSVFFTAYTIPKKLSRITTARYSLFQAIGFFGCSLIAYLIHCAVRGAGAEPLTDIRLLYSALSGVAWFFGCVFFFQAIDEMGLSRSNQWKNLQGPLGAIFNLLFLAEYRQTNVLFILLSCAAILLSAVFLNVRKEEEKKGSHKGIFFALLAAVLFGINSMLLKQGTNFGFVYSQQVVLSGMVFVSSVIYLPLRERKRAHLPDKKGCLLGVLGGILFFAASSFSLQSYNLLPGSITFTIIQLNSVWTVLVGVLIFREIDFRKNWQRITAGLICAVIGIILLLFA